MVDPVANFTVDPDMDLMSFTARQSTALLDDAPFEAFLDYIYTVLLNRRPDPEGAAFYHRLDRAGLARADAVRRLLRSTERRHRAVEYGGREAALKTYVRAARLARLPMVGHWLVRRYHMLRRLERIGVNQLVLAHRMDRMRRDIALLLEQDELVRFANDAPRSSDPDSLVFRMAFARARRDL